MTGGLVRVRFTSKGHIGSELAALPARAGGFNHVMIIDAGMVYEAVSFHGVRYVTLKVAMRGIRRYQDMLVFVPNLEAMREFLRQQLGADYDLRGAMGMPFLRSGDWQDPEQWWCAEYAIAGCGSGGVWFVDEKRARWGTLRDIYMQKYPKTEIIYCNHLTMRSP